MRSVPQLVIEVTDGLAARFDRAFGKGSFASWMRRMRESDSMGDAWCGDEDPPPVCFLASDRLTEDLSIEGCPGLPPPPPIGADGIVRGRRHAIKVRAVETGVEDVPVSLRGWICAVPAREGDG
jgi:hypothetical protein